MKRMQNMIFRPTFRCSRTFARGTGHGRPGRGVMVVTAGTAVPPVSADAADDPKLAEFGISTSWRPILALLACTCALLAFSQARAQQQELTPAQQKAADLRLPELDRTALLPEKRAPTEVKPGERVPFGLVSVPPPEEKETVAPIKAETEEMKIRRILGNMRASGLGGEPGDYTVLLGPLKLRAGEELPRLFANQAEVLRVTSVTDRNVVITFAEKDPNLPPRTIGLNFDLKPRVHSLLAGELFTKAVPFDKKGAPDLKPIETQQVKDLLETLKQQEFQSLIERRTELMGEASQPTGQSEQETPKSD